MAFIDQAGYRYTEQGKLDGTPIPDLYRLIPPSIQAGVLDTEQYRLYQAGFFFFFSAFLSLFILKHGTY